MRFLGLVEKLLDMAPRKKMEVLNELDSHIALTADELVESGMSSDDAISEAESRMGTPEDVAQRLNAEYNSSSWISAILTAIPFFASLVFYLLPKAGRIQLNGVILTGLIIAFFSIRELIRGRRPVWLGPCMALGFLCCVYIIKYILVLYGNPDYYSTSRSAMICITGFLLITFASSLIIQKWRRFTLLIAVLSSPAIIFLILNGPTSDTKGAPIYFALLLAMYPILLVIFSRCVFEFHKYGNAVQASVFILSMYILASPGIITSMNRSIAALLTGTMIIFITKSSSRKHKIKLLEYTIAVFLFCNEFLASLHEDLVYALIAPMISLAMLYYILHWYILIPINAENRINETNTPLTV